jgi:hypothetical protein
MPLPVLWLLSLTASALIGCSSDRAFSAATDGDGGSGGAAGMSGANAGGGSAGGAGAAGAAGTVGVGGTAGAAGMAGAGVGVCTPHARTCADGVAQRCNADGTAFVTRTDCTAIGAQCLKGLCETGLLAYWPFDERTGELAGDASGNGHHGTVVDGQWVTGHSGGAIALEIPGSHIDVGDRLHDVVVPFSVASWVFAKPSDGARVLVASDANTTSWNGFWVQRGPAGIWEVTFGSGSGAGPRTRRTLESTDPLPNETWVHIAAVVEGPTDMTLYVNGVQVAGTLGGSGGPMLHTSDPFYIGTRDRTTSWDGRIDELRIYGRALEPSEVATLAGL